VLSVALFPHAALQNFEGVTGVGPLKSVLLSQAAALDSSFVKGNARAHFLRSGPLETTVRNRIIPKSSGKPPLSDKPLAVREACCRVGSVRIGLRLGGSWDSEMGNRSFRSTLDLVACGAGQEASRPQACRAPVCSDLVFLGAAGAAVSKLTAKWCQFLA